MLLLLVLWTVLGLLVALIVHDARPWPAARSAPHWGPLLAEGALSGLLGGWLGSLAFGRFYGAPTALWFSAVLLVAGPWLVLWLRSRSQAGQTGEKG